MSRVAVCVATYRRPEPLAVLLRSLAALTFTKREADIFLVVVDNDVTGSARGSVEALGTGYPWPVHYEMEPERNIALARNRAIDTAIARAADFIAFIDDDETSAPEWLEELLDVQVRFEADIVGGALVPRYSDGTARWVRKGRFFEIPRRPTGAEVEMVFTGNVLISVELVRDERSRFDPFFGLSGGEDSHFFMRAHEAGARMIWANEAVVEELVPLTRTSGDWILRRAFRVGNSYVFCERALFPRRRWLLPRVGKAALRIAEGLVLLIPSAVSGRAGVFRSLRKVAHGLGCLSAIGGIRKYGYQVVPRS